MMRWQRRMQPGDRGFTLVETLASLVVFTLVTLGVVPLLLSATRGATLSRSFTVAKNLSLQAMERVRGLPYFVSFANQPKLVDVLDFYYPNATGAVGGVFTTTCTSATTGNPACPDNIGAGYTVTYAAEFIAPGAVVDGKETFVTVAPPSTYTRTSSPADIPPTRLVRMKVETTWTAAGAARRYALTSFFGERHLAQEKVRALARVDYTVNVLTSYVDNDPAGRVSDLVVDAGSSESRIETRTLSQADQTVRSATLRLARPPDPASTTDTGLNLTVLGANSFVHAAPDQDPAAGDTRAAQALNHPELDLTPQIGYLSKSTTGGPLRVKTAGDLPIASGAFTLNDLAALDTYDLWVNNQADTTKDALLRLDPLTPVFSVRPRGGEDLVTRVLSGRTSATTTDGSTKKVDAAASAELGQIRLFPVTFIVTDEKSVIVVNEVKSSVSCSASGGGAAQSASYSATLKYWKEANPNDGVQAGSYETVTLASTQAADPLPGVGNPMVYEDPVSADAHGSALDIYLFPVKHSEADHNVDANLNGVIESNVTAHDHPGYITDWQSAVAPLATSEDAGRLSRARIDGAIRINTRPSNPSIPQTGLNISIAKMSCEAVDRR